MYVASELNNNKSQLMASNGIFATVRASDLKQAKEFMMAEFKNFDKCHYTTINTFRNVLGKEIKYKSYSFIINR